MERTNQETSDKFYIRQHENKSKSGNISSLRYYNFLNDFYEFECNCNDVEQTLKTKA